METKACTKCGEEKPATTEYFVVARLGLFGVSSQCKRCKKAYYEKNKEKFALWHKTYREKNKEKVAMYAKQYRQENKEKVLARDKKYRQENKEKIAAYKRKHSQELPAGIYKILNKETGRIYIGASTVLPQRWSRHRSLLYSRNHNNQNMQEEYNKYGLEAFEFEVLEGYPPDTQLETLEKREQEEIKKRLSEGQSLYNIVVKDK